MQHHLPRPDRLGGLNRTKESRSDQGAQFGILVVDVEPLIRAMDTDPSTVTREGSLGRKDTIRAVGAKCGQCHEILQFDIALRIEKPRLVGGNFGTAKASSYFQGGHLAGFLLRWRFSVRSSAVG